MTDNKEPHFFATTGKQMSLAALATIIVVILFLAFCG